MDKEYIVTKSNYFIMNSSYDLSLEEQKIILTLASMVHPNDEEFKPYKFKIVEFMQLLGVEDKSKYIEIPKLTKELMKKVFEIKEDKALIQTAWLSGAKYEKGSGMVELTFSPYLKPYMLKLNTMFTQYKLGNILSMKSKYSPRIYELLKCNEFKKQSYLEIEVEELRKLLKADTIYPKYNDFKRYIIERTQKELKKISDISFDFEEIKTGRKVTSIRFFINSNSNKTKRISKEINTHANDEIAATVVEELEIDYINKIKAIIESYCNKKIGDKTAIDFYNLAKKNEVHKGNPLKLITEIAEYSTTQNIKNLNAWFKTMLKDYEKPLQKVKQLKFNNFKGRDYDYDDLEKKLLGWD